MSVAASSFRYSEAKFAEMIGISSGDFAKYLRDPKLTKDEHWRRENGEIALTLPGIKRVWRCLEKKPAQLDLQACELSNGSEKKVISLMPPRTMRITQVPVNPAILKARDALGQDYTLRRGAGFFYVGLELEAVPDAQPGLWRVVGPVPRFMGDRAYRQQAKK